VTSSEENLGHLGVGSAIAATFFAYCRLSVLQELQAVLCWAPILHLINGFLNEAEEVVDVLGADEITLLRCALLVEVQVGIQDLDQKVEVLGLSHADLRGLERLAKLGHDLIALLAALAEEEMRSEADGLRLQVFLQKLVGVADGVATQRLKVLRSETSQRVQGCHEELQAIDLVLALRHFLLKDDVGLRHELVCLILQLSDLLEVVDGLASL